VFGHGKTAYATYTEIQNGNRDIIKAIRGRVICFCSCVAAFHSVFLSAKKALEQEYYPHLEL